MYLQLKLYRLFFGEIVSQQSLSQTHTQVRLVCADCFYYIATTDRAELATHRQLEGSLAASAWGRCWPDTCTSRDHSPARSWGEGTRSGGRCKTAWCGGSAWSRCGGWTGWSGCPRAPTLPATRHANPGPRYTTLTFHTSHSCCALLVQATQGRVTLLHSVTLLCLFVWLYTI